MPEIISGAGSDPQLQLQMMERAIDGEAKRLGGVFDGTQCGDRTAAGQHLQAHDDALPEEERACGSAAPGAPAARRSSILQDAAAEAGITLATYVREQAIRSVASGFFATAMRRS
jgi:hypothetical protein